MRKYNASGSLVVIDEADNLRLVNYSDDIPDIDDDQYRGRVMDDTGRCVCASHPYTDERLMEEYTYDPTCETIRAYEGTIVRLFCVEQATLDNQIVVNDDGLDHQIIRTPTKKWYFSTYKRIDGRRSRWGASRTFYDMFTELFPEDKWSQLDSSYAYTFLLCHRDNQMCYEPERNRLILTLKWHIPSQKFETVLHDTPLEYYELPEYADADTEPSAVGFLVNRYGDSKLDNYKYVTNTYIDDRRIRGNEPNLRMAYYGSENRQRFRELLSSKREQLDEFDQQLALVAERVYDEYYRRFVRQEQCTYPPEFYSVLKQIRVTYGREYESLPTTEQRDIVNRVLSRYNARVLNACVKYIQE